MPKSWSHPVVIAIVSGLIVGVFSLAPTAYDYLTSDATVLSYSINRGPDLRTGNEYKRIHYATIFNDGTTKINDIYARFTLDSGSIEELSTENNPGVSFSEKNKQWL